MWAFFTVDDSATISSKVLPFIVSRVKAERQCRLQLCILNPERLMMRVVISDWWYTEMKEIRVNKKENRKWDCEILYQSLIVITHKTVQISRISLCLSPSQVCCLNLHFYFLCINMKNIFMLIYIGQLCSKETFVLINSNKEVYRLGLVFTSIFIFIFSTLY